VPTLTVELLPISKIGEVITPAPVNSRLPALTLIELKPTSAVVTLNVPPPPTEMLRPDKLAAEYGLSGSGYRLSEVQAQAILDLRLHRLTGLERGKIVAEFAEILERIRDLSDIIARPLGILTTATTYVSNVVYTGYTWFTDEIAAFNLPPLFPALRPPMPLASVGGSSARALATRNAGPRAAAAPARASRIALRGAVRAATVGTRQTARAVVKDSTEVRSTPRATRGATSRAAKAARTAVESVANTAS